MGAVLERFFDAVEHLALSDWLGVLGLLLGLVGVVGYVEQKRQSKAMDAIAKLALRNAQSVMTQDELQALTDRLSATQKALEDIPALAKDAVAREQAELHKRAMLEHLDRWVQAQGSAAVSTALSAVDPQLRTEILERLLPRHLADQRRTLLRDRITILSVSAAFVVGWLPYPLSGLVRTLLGGWIVVNAVVLWLVGLEADARARALRRTVRGAYAGTLVVAAAFGGIAVYVHEGSLVTGMGAACLSAAALLLVLWRRGTLLGDRLAQAAVGPAIASPFRPTP